MNILDVTKRIAVQKGEVGIEIEVEGHNLPEELVGWRREHDGSLRGECCEYVLKVPCKREKVPDYLGRIEKGYRDFGTKVKESERQSIHIHINVQDIDLVQVYNFITLFLIFEHSLVEFCGEHRQGNLFCLRSEDAEGLFSVLEESASPDTIRLLNTDDIRYSAINVASLFKYGSLEFRSMRGTDDFGLVQTWISLLLSLKDAAKNYASPIEIVTDLSAGGVGNFTTAIFGDNAHIIKDKKNWDVNLYSNMRSLQSLVYSGDWEGLKGEYKGVEEGLRGRPQARFQHDGDVIPGMGRPKNPAEIIRDIKRRQAEVREGEARVLEEMAEAGIPVDAPQPVVRQAFIAEPVMGVDEVEVVPQGFIKVKDPRKKKPHIEIFDDDLPKGEW